MRKLQWNWALSDHATCLVLLPSGVQDSQEQPELTLLYLPNGLIDWTGIQQWEKTNLSTKPQEHTGKVGWKELCKWSACCVSCRGPPRALPLQYPGCRASRSQDTCSQKGGWSQPTSYLPILQRALRTRMLDLKGTPEASTVREGPVTICPSRAH